MKRIVLCTVAFGFGLALHAQTVRHVEFEPFIGVTYPLANLPGSEFFGPNLGFELRYNFSRLPLDIGLEESIAVANREDAVLRASGDFDNLTLRNWSTSLTADCNFLTGQRVSPFFGLGAGIAQRIKTNPSIGSYEEVDEWGAAFQVRVGVELFNHFRITVSSRLTAEAFDTVCLRIGYAFGGGLKKWVPRTF